MANPRYVQLARVYAKRFGVDPNVFVRQINAESSFNPRSTSSAGAQGIAQFMPATAASEGVNVNSVRSSLKGAARLDAKLIRQTGSYRKGLAAYNAGPGNIGAGLGYADSILGGKNPKLAGGSASGATTKTIPGVDNSGTRKQLIATYLLGQQGIGSAGVPNTDQLVSQSQNLLDTVLAVRAAKDRPARTVTVGGGGSADTSAKGTVTFGGKRVAAWIAPALQYARAHGWKGSVTSGFRSFADQQRIYNSGVRPAAKPGTSNHEGTQFPRGAVDVTNAAQLSQILQRSPFAGKLVWAGSKDPVHFSNPHNGSY